MCAADADENGEEMERVGILLAMSVNAWRDMKKKEINLMVTGLLFLYGVIKMFVCSGNLLEQSIPVGIGGVFMGLSVISQGGIGMGDSLLLLALGMILSLEEYSLMLCLGMLLCAFYAAFMLAIMKKGKKSELPFVPFLLLGYVGGIFLCS